ncbi:hypothetical protein [Halobacterium wangiae]|uniref:hypothetical protein n=1 Tax=Halobacterium wangiae TaxID=2902623 RepID=UPI001E2FEF0B|nr:hypothetical protein [Halobacterium wangiae]
MDGILNTTTNTVHKHGSRDSHGRTVCGATKYLSDGQLDRVDVDQAVTDKQASKCGRCFSDGGGY